MGLKSIISKLRKKTPYASQKVYGELGWDKQTAGLPDMEFMSELSPPEGLKRYRIMQYNDPIVGGLLIQIKGVMKRLRWSIEGPNADFVMKQLQELPRGLEGLLGEIAEGFTYGFFVGEMIWKVDNSTITLVDVEPRYQTTIQSIEPKGKIEQLTSDGTFKIPYQKCIHHVFFSESRNPYGVSLLRHLYKPYFYKVSIEAAEAIGVDRDLGGLPVLKAPEGFDFTAATSGSPNYDAKVAATLDWAVELVGKVRKDQQQGIVLPSGWEFTLVRGESRTSIPTTDIIGRLNTEMAIGVLENFLAMGAFSSTNNANVEMHVSNFLTACDAYAKDIATTINYTAIRKICDYNNKKSYPRLDFSPARTSNLQDLASFVARLVANGVITPTKPLEKSLLEIADLPYDTNEANIKPLPEKK